MKKITTFLVFLGLMIFVSAQSSHAVSFDYDNTLSPYDQGFVLTAAYSTHSVTPNGSYTLFHLDTGSVCAATFDKAIGATLGTGFTMRVDASVTGRGGAYFYVGTHVLGVYYDPEFNQQGFGVFDSGLNKIESYELDSRQRHLYEITVDANGDYVVTFDGSEVITGTGWSIGDVRLSFSGDNSFHTYTFDTYAYEFSFEENPAPVAVPEPATIILSLIGLVSLYFRKK